MKKALFAAVLVASAAHAAPGGVTGSKHDLSVSGPGPIRATEETRVCIFCHVSHGGGERMTNRPDGGGASARPYESSTMKGRAGTPTGASRLCLSCHDGTIAVGKTRRGTVKMTATENGRISGARRANLGTDLRKTHPVSFEPMSDKRTRRPMDRNVHLDGAGQLQCTSCHDPHAEYGGSAEGKFLVKGTANSALCVTCHQPTPGSSHASSGARFGAAAGNEAGFGSVGEAGCAACHRSHSATAKGRLLATGDLDDGDALCLRCHRGGVARADVGADLAKPYAHGVNGDVHDASEGPDSAAHRLPETSGGARRHAACVDCHDPHDASDAPAVPPAVPGALAGTWGIDQQGRPVEPARNEYEICLKCHGDSANIRNQPGRALAVRRAFEERNLRLAFGAAAASAHPVMTPGRNADVPSLRVPWSTGSLVYCSDCHASDSGPGAGGSGARGPHGSVYSALLERNYTTGDLVPETASAYALCYKCHDRDTLLSDRSAFRLHATHVVRNQTPCSVCHASHAVAGPGANAANNAHLIDFDVAVVRPGAGGLRRYDARGPRAGGCTLLCHGRSHDGASY